MQEITSRLHIQKQPGGGLSKHSSRVFIFVLILIAAAYPLIHSQTAKAAVSYRSCTSAENATGGTTLTINKPSGAVTGDILVFTLANDTINPPSLLAGWTQVFSDWPQGTPTTAMRHTVAYRVLTAADSGTSSFTWTLPSSVKAVGTLVSYSGVDTSNPVNISGSTENGSVTTLTAQSVTTTVANTLILAVFSNHVNSTHTAGGGMSQRCQTMSSGGGSGGSKLSVSAQDIAQVSAGATGNKTASTSAASAGFGTIVALNPAPPSTLEQSAYRWFNNTDTSVPNTFAAAVGGTGDDKGYSIAQTLDGGYVLTGYVSGYGGGGMDMFVSKYDASGNVVWTKVWGGTGNDKGQGVVATSDGGFAVAGITASYGAGGDDAFIAKYAADGTLSWSKTWGGTGTDWAYSLVQTSDGGYAMAGDTTSQGNGEQLWFAKLDSAGNISYSRVLGGAGIDYARNIKQTSDGGFILAGYTASYAIGTNSALLVKYDSAGNYSWTRVWGGTSGDYAYGVVQTSDGGYAMTGTSASYKAAGANATEDVFLAKFDSAGTIEWSRTWGAAQYDYGRMVANAADGGIVITGSGNLTGNFDAFLAKFTLTGTLSWSKTIGAAGVDNGFTVIPTNDGGFAQVVEAASYGAGTYDALIAKRDSSGDIANCGTNCTSPAVTTSSPTVSPTSPTPTTSSPVVTLGTPTPTNGDFLPTHTIVAAISPSGIDVGTPLATTNTVATVPSSGTGFRLRMNLHVGAALLGANQGSFKLRYAPKGAAASCSVLANGNYADVTDTTAIRYFDNPNAGSALSLTVNANDPTHASDTLVRQRYREKGTTIFPNMDAIGSGQDGMWDFGLTHVGATPSSNYCLKIVKSDGTDINTYTVFPELTIPAAASGPTIDQQLRGGQAVVNGVKSPFSW